LLLKPYPFPKALTPLNRAPCVWDRSEETRDEAAVVTVSSPSKFCVKECARVGQRGRSAACGERR